MNTNQPKITSIRLALLGLCVLGIVPIAGPGCASANKTEKDAAFTDTRDLNPSRTPALAQAVPPANPPATKPPAETSTPEAKPQPPANTNAPETLAAQQAQGKTLYAF